MRVIPRAGVLTVILACLATHSPGQSPAELRVMKLDDVRARFGDPPAAYRPAPLWVWNDDLEESELARQLDEFQAQGFGGVFVHPRPGLVTPYLSDRWLQLWQFTVQEAKKRGMVTYLYDENSYPSGFAGGHVPAQMPQAREMHLRQRRLGGDEIREQVFDQHTLALLRSDRPAAPKTFSVGRVVIEPDGRTGAFFADGVETRRFRFGGEPLSGSVAFRVTHGRSAIVDDVRFFQIDAAGETHSIFEDDFERAALGETWTLESLEPGTDDIALAPRIDNGRLVLAHDGTPRDCWLRVAADVSFQGRTSVVEFRLVERRSRDLTPSLAIGAKPYRDGVTGGAMLLEIQGATPHVGWGMLRGAWVQGRASAVVAESEEFTRVALPELPQGRGRTGAELDLAPANYVVYDLEPGRPSPWHAGKTYVNLSEKGVGAKFLEVTLGAYDRVLADEYGDSVLACFTDEPHAGAWSSDFAEVFARRHGYSILDHLPSIWLDVGDWRSVRHDYSVTLLELWTERFLKPYHDACEARGIAFTGHVWEHSWPRTGIGPDTMSFNAWEHWPGIDCLMNNYGEGPHAQFGNYRANLEIRSIANQLDRPRTLCEAYGAAGWELTFQDMKRIGDWLHAGGINFLNPHLAYYTIRGARKRDHPLSFSYHEPWWEAYHLAGDYFGRLSWALAAGRGCNPILVIEPTTTAWMYNWSTAQSGRLDEIGEQFQGFVTELGAAQVDFDLGSEPVMATHARVDGHRLWVGACAYETVFLPPRLENLESSTIDLLAEFVAGGGTVVSCGEIPRFVDGRASDRATRTAAGAPERWLEAVLSPAEIRARFGHRGVVVRATPVSDGRVYHLLRELDDGWLLFVANCSSVDTTHGTIRAAGAHVERWLPIDGTISAVRCLPGAPTAALELSWDFELPPTGSALYAIHRAGTPRRPRGEDHLAGGTALAPSGALSIEALEANVLPLDYVDLVLRDKIERGLYFYDAQTRIYRTHGFDRNPWDSAVQFEDELLRRNDFAEDSGFELRYPFTIGAVATMPSLELVVERGDRYEVSVNDRVLRPIAGRSWLDRSFRVYAIPEEVLKQGRNEVATRARPFSVHHEPEPVYLLGDFSLLSAERGFSIEPATAMRLGAWSAQGRPCYPGRVAYRQSVELADEPTGATVELGAWHGVVARVDVNGETAGYIGWPPWRCEIGAHLKSGTNTVTVVVFGTLKNLLGPHHNGPVRGSAWPGMFRRGGAGGQPPGSAYDVIDCGLDEPFTVRVR